jgi:hypothetical protein
MIYDLPVGRGDHGSRLGADLALRVPEKVQDEQRQQQE